MNWSIIVGVAVGLVVGINLGVLLMVALQAGKRQEQSYDQRVLLARIQELERAQPSPPTQPGPSGTLKPFELVDQPPKADKSGEHRVTG